MGEPIILPEDVTSALLQIKNDGAAAAPTKEQLRNLRAEVAGQDGSSSSPCEVRLHSVYVFRSEQIRVTWHWRLELGALKRIPWPRFASASSASEQDWRLGPQGQLLRRSGFGFFLDTRNFAPSDPEDSKTVLEWIAEWAGPQIRNRYENLGRLTDTLCQMLDGVENISDELREGAKLSPGHWFFFGRARERLSIEAAEYDGKSPSDRIRSSILGSKAAGEKQSLRRQLDRGEIEKEKKAFLPIAKSIRTSSPTTPRGQLAARVLDQLPTGSPGKKLTVRAAAARLKELESEGKLASKSSTPRTAERRT